MDDEHPQLAIPIQTYMDWEGPFAKYAGEKDSKSKGKEPNGDNYKDMVIVKNRGPYFSKNDKKVARLINLLQEFEHMSIREGAQKVGLPALTAIRKVKQFNEATEKTNDYTVIAKEHKNRQSKLHDEHTYYIFERLVEEPTMTVQAVTDSTPPYAKPMSPYIQA
ncbi:hypothetical protein DFQ28_003930 [Apophysomyces sp. BC1034]|nr:hypothetical protein DFQ30_003933 [Apophysomyces sp. BC1015]KAG0177285.1 hypothetical protein DFQ29_005023 [Apophysomyces sp. BC1021]KAG0189082.1 hypothetical protein DFQ28_003930 [Apophysomyces sp. BC1034]